MVRNRLAKGQFVAVLTAGTATLFRFVLDPILGLVNIFGVFYFAIFFAATYVGLRPAMTTLFAGLLAADVFFIPPRGSLEIASFQDRVGIFFYLAIGSIIAWQAGSMRKNLRLAELSSQRTKRSYRKLKEMMAERISIEYKLREKQDQLVQSAKLASIGELATGVAHELNNPLNNIGLIIGNVIDDLETRSADSDKNKVTLRLAQEEVRRAATIIQDLRTFARKAPMIREPVSITEVVRKALSLVDYQLRLRNIDVSLELPEDEALCSGNAIHLEQVMLNLLTNASDALEERLHRQIHLRVVTETHTIRIECQDTGMGIPSDLHDRIFDPFFTTKEVGKGTGLGLSIAYGIIKEHGGNLTFQSGLEQGTTFIVELPLLVDASRLNAPESLST